MKLELCCQVKPIGKCRVCNLSTCSDHGIMCSYCDKAYHRKCYALTNFCSICEKTICGLCTYVGLSGKKFCEECKEWDSHGDFHNYPEEDWSEER